MKKLEKMSFGEAMEELKNILSILEEGRCSLEEAVAQSERAAQLRSFCENKLLDAENKLHELKKNEEKC